MIYGVNTNYDKVGDNMQSAGKKFEQAIKNSIPDYCFTYRLHDPPQSFNTNIAGVRFSWKNPCDYFVFDNQHRFLLALELKSTKAKSIGFENIDENNNQQSRMIHKHQIESLLDFNANNDYIVGGFLFNFRNEDNGAEICFYQNANDFYKMTKTLGKKSFNAIDLIKSNTAIKVDSTKKRVNYLWDIDTLLQQISQQINER